MKLADPNLQRALQRLTPAERAAIEQAARTGRVTALAREALHRLKRILKRMVRG